MRKTLARCDAAWTRSVAARGDCVPNAHCGDALMHGRLKPIWNASRWWLGFFLAIGTLPGFAWAGRQDDSSTSSIPNAVVRTSDFGAAHDIGDDYQCRVLRCTDPTGSQYWLR